MHFRHSPFCFLIIAFITSCQDNSSQRGDGQLQQKTILLSVNADSVDSNFYQFLARFNEDSTFQFQRILFPLKIKQYNLSSEEDTIFYKQQNEYMRIAFQKAGLLDGNSEWKQNIIPDGSGKSVTVEIRGIENGIMVDYLFEKKEGKWLLVSVNDSST